MKNMGRGKGQGFLTGNTELKLYNLRSVEFCKLAGSLENFVTGFDFTSFNFHRKICTGTPKYEVVTVFSIGIAELWQVTPCALVY